MEEVAVGWAYEEDGSRETTKSHALGKHGWGVRRQGRPTKTWWDGVYGHLKEEEVPE